MPSLPGALSYAGGEGRRGPRDLTVRVRQGAIPFPPAWRREPPRVEGATEPQNKELTSLVNFGASRLNSGFCGLVEDDVEQGQGGQPRRSGPSTIVITARRSKRPSLSEELAQEEGATDPRSCAGLRMPGCRPSSRVVTHGCQPRSRWSPRRACARYRRSRGLAGDAAANVVSSALCPPAIRRSKALRPLQAVSVDAR